MADPSREALEALHQAERAHDRIQGHEELCSQRWNQLNQTLIEVKASIRRLYSQQWAAAGAVILALLGAVAFLYGKLSP